jgi:hypothetical protein
MTQKGIVIHSYLRFFLIIVLGVTLFALILLNRYPHLFRPAAIQIRYGFTIPIPVIFLILTFVMWKDRWINVVGLFLMCLTIFAMALVGLWASGQTEGQVISGILPDTDAAFYYYDSLRLAYGFQFSYFGAMRLFFSAFLGFILQIVSFNLQITIGILVFMLAVSCFFATFGIWKRFGSLPASLFFVLIFTFARLSIGKLMSESLGLSLSCLSFYFFLDFSNTKKNFPLFLAVFLWIVALIARAGPVTIIPSLLFGIYLVEKNKKNLKRLVIIVILASVLVFSIFNLFSLVFGPENSIPFANFVHPLYGLAKGGAGWSRIFIDHPEITKFEEPEYTREIFNYALLEIKENPGIFLFGILSQYPQIINFPEGKGFYSFFGGENEYIFLAAQIIIYLLSILYFIFVIVDKRYQNIRYFAFALLGILILVPVFPFSDFEHMRVYAAAIPFITVFPVLGLYILINKLPLYSVNIKKNLVSMKSAWFIFSILLVAIIVLGPLLILAFKRNVDPKEQICTNNQDSVVVQLSRGSYFKLLRESTFYLDWLPYYHESRFRTNLHNLTNYSVEAFENVYAPEVVTSTIDVRNGQAVILVLPDEQLLHKHGFQTLCGKWDEYDYSDHNARLFFVDGVGQ